MPDLSRRRAFPANSLEAERAPQAAAGIAPEETPRATNEETFDLSGKNGNPGGAGSNVGD